MREFVATFALVFGFFYVLTIVNVQPPMPRCEEDAIIIGDGDFKDGRWDYYICGPSFDDLEDAFEAGPDED